MVTLPKVSAPAQVSVFGDILAELEGRLGLAPIPLEVQVETPAAVLALPAVSEGCPQSWSACGASRVRSGQVTGQDTDEVTAMSTRPKRRLLSSATTLTEGDYG